MVSLDGRVCGGVKCRAVLGLFLSIVLMLGLFSAAASLVMLLLAWSGMVAVGLGGMLARVGLFGAMGVASFGGLIWMRRLSGGLGGVDGSPQGGMRGLFILHPSSFILLPVLVLLALVALPRLGAYPWMAPDEAHHLGVARNLAVFGVYGSGLPETGFVWFDNYDSVGAPVIVPVAGAMALVGADPVTSRTVAAGRVVMGLYFGFLCVGMYLLIAPVAGVGAALAGLVAMLAMPGSVYLARTLYGEAPALAWLAAGLVVWRWPGRIVPGLVAGACFGLAVLCKSIVVLAGFAFLGVLCFEVALGRRVRWLEWLTPAIGGVAIIAAWWAVQVLLRHDVTGAAGGTLAEYQHNLMFGVRCLARTIPALFREPFTWLVALAGLTAATATFSERRYDRSLAALFMIAVFYLYWWLFFTPGHIPRYFWFSQSVGGLFAGVAVWKAWCAIGRVGIVKQILLGVLVVLVAAPLGVRFVGVIGTVWTADEMGADYEVASEVRDLPQSAIVRTVDKPLEWTLNLLARRQVEVVEGIELQGAPGVWTIVKEDNARFRLIAPSKMK